MGSNYTIYSDNITPHITFSLIHMLQVLSFFDNIVLSYLNYHYMMPVYLLAKEYFFFFDKFS
jgi:hypothetical protein